MHDAVPLLIARNRGLVIFTPASGAVRYVFGAAYGAHKAGMDKFAADMAVDFRPFGVASLSIWMGALVTERLQALVDANPSKFGHLLATAETPEFTGHIIWGLFNDPAVMDIRRQTVIGAEMALKYGITDTGGRQPPSNRDTHQVAPRVQYPNIIR